MPPYRGVPLWRVLSALVSRQDPRHSIGAFVSAIIPPCGPSKIAQEIGQYFVLSVESVLG